MTKRRTTPAADEVEAGPAAAERDLPPYVISRRPGLEQLHRALYLCTAAQRRLAWHNKRNGDAVTQDRISALVVLMVEREATHGMLAREAGLNPATVTTMIEQLEAQGMVRRRRDTTDRRVVWISATEKGRRVISERQELWDQVFAESFADTTDEELAIASRVLDRLSGLFEGLIPEGD